MELYLLNIWLGKEGEEIKDNSYSKMVLSCLRGLKELREIMRKRMELEIRFYYLFLVAFK